MSVAFGKHVRAAFAPPRYLAPPLAGIDVSTSAVKAVRLVQSAHGLTLGDYAEAILPAGTFTDGEITDRAAIVRAIMLTAHKVGISSADVGLPESKSYLFETDVSGEEKRQWHTTIEQKLQELVPLPPALTTFDVLEIGRTSTGDVRVIGVTFAERVVEDVLTVFDQAKVRVRALEGENFALARALLPPSDTSTTLIVDIGKMTTKICIVTRRIPRFATTIGIGGHALTIAIQKYFGVTEEEAKRVKAERGIVPGVGNEEYLGAMLSTLSAIRDEISNRLDYWQVKAASGSVHEPVSRAILVGGNACMRGLSEYLENTLRIPVTTGDVFTNFASRDTWFPNIDYSESLAYATAIGLALYECPAL